MENYLASFYSLNLFNSLSREVLSALGVNERKIDLILKSSNKEKQRRSAYCKVSNLSSQNQETQETKTHSSFQSFSRISIKNQQFTTEKYSSKVKTANHFVIFNFGGKKRFAKIIAIRVFDKRIFFKEGVVCEEDKEKMEDIFLGRCSKVVFDNQIKDIGISLENLQKVVGLQIGAFCFLVEI